MDNRVGFIQWIIGENEVGWVGLAARIADTNQWHEKLFEYPGELSDVEAFIKKHTPTSDIYFCPTILIDDRRVKENIQTSWVLYADLDDCHPDNLLLPPSIVLETSPYRYQGFWKLKDKAHALDVEKANYRIAYNHINQGADPGGWDLTQLLRVPGTRNFKYDSPYEVRVFRSDTFTTYSVEDVLRIYPEVNKSVTDIPDIPFPEFLPDVGSDEILDTVRGSVNSRVWGLFQDPPQIDRSKNLWQLMLFIFDVGLSREEVFIVARDAACNKFNSDILLWKDVLRAESYAKNKSKLVSASNADVEDVNIFIPNKSILTDDERREISEFRTIIDIYMDWATTVTDAAPQYHIAGIFSILSTLLSGSLRLPTSFGEVKPNLWFMILGDTTTSRKSTTMDMAVDIIDEIDNDALLATDGTTEGLITALSLRPSRVSLFHRDEVSGLIDAMAKKDYNSGLLETFTKLYDGKRMKRILRKETIDVQDPVLVLLTGGTKDGVFGAFNSMHIASGFVPRFCFVSAESDPSRLRGLGPPSAKNNKAKAGVVWELENIYKAHNVLDPDNPFSPVVKKIVTLTGDAWSLYNIYESSLAEIAKKSNIENLMAPMMARLSMSGLKAAVLIAASIQLDEVVVDVQHIKKAFYYVDVWKNYAFEVVLNAGRTAQERELDLINQMIERSGDKGMTRSSIMQSRRLLARDADVVFTTLEQRGLIIGKRIGRGVKYYSNKALKPIEVSA